MPDWIGTDGASTSHRYRSMAEHELRGLSPSYEAICLGVADDTALCARLDTLPPPKRQPNLLLATVRYLDGPVDSFARFRAFVLDRWDDVAATMRARRTQTNESGRCATLLPWLAGLPGPLALLEVGASAGLCLYPDRYGYRYETDTGTTRLGDAPTLDCRVTGDVPLPDTRPDVVWRAGLDLNPLDVRDDDDVRWLEALVWPEQTERFDRLRAAVDLARAEPPTLVRGDLTTDLVTLADRAPSGATLVVFHSAVLAYVDAPGRSAFVERVRALAAGRPTVWLANEAPGVLPGTGSTEIGAGRFVLSVDGVPVARTGPHGQSLAPFGGGPPHSGRQGT